MHKKIILSLLLASTLLCSQEIKNEKFQLISKDIDTKENIVTATGSVVVFSPTYYLSADKIIYDKDNETFELFDNVLIIKDNNIQTQSNYAFVDLKNDVSNQNPMFLYANDNKIWVNSKTSLKEKDVIELDSSIISSCDCLDPLWSIRASSADYDIEDKWINAYNPRLYIKNVPILYSPYLGFPTDTTRRTGLLLPTIGYSKYEGFHYSQPIFFAPAVNYDFELIPQVRTKRGYGSYLYYRYADSRDSILEMKTGVFKEENDYVKKNSLENDLHYGINLDYQRRNIFSNTKHDDGLYASLNYLNDVEYITLEEDDYIFSTDKKVESKINYFYNTPDYYAGTYARYYIDTSRKSNNETLQELPQVQFHAYNKESFIDNLIYSADTKMMNYTRPKGLNAKVYELSVPISYSKYFADDFMYLAFENKTILSKYDYDNFTNSDYKDGTLLQNRSSVSVGSDLIKPYTNYLHTLNLNAEYVIPKNLKDDGDLFGITVKKEDSVKYENLKAFPIIEEKKEIILSANQSLYNKGSLKQFINHKISQSILYDEVDNPRLQNLENYVKLNHDYGSVSGKIIYNVEDKEYVENSANTTFTYEDFSIGLGYFKSKQSENNPSREDLESYTASTSYKIAKDYRVSYYESYNLLEKIRSKQGISFNMDDNCWNLDIRYENEVVPSSSSDPKGVEQQIVFVNLILKPIGGLKQKYKMENNN